MNNQPAFDRSILVPIFISAFSVIGIVVVLLIGRFMSAPPEVPVTPSATRFSYVYLGTEPAITTPLVEETEPEPEFPEFTEEPIEEPGEEPEPVFTAVFTTPTRPLPSTPIVLTVPIVTNSSATATTTSASVAPLNPGTYDNVDFRIAYTGSWQQSSVPGAYQNTLHVSSDPGPPASTISFRFIGTQLRLLYQGGSTLGELRITIDSTSVTLDQSSGNEWVSDTFANSTHTVSITHTGGGSVNIDQIIIPEIPNTATVTVTPTRTSIP